MLQTRNKKQTHPLKLTHAKTDNFDTKLLIYSTDIVDAMKFRASNERNSLTPRPALWSNSMFGSICHKSDVRLWPPRLFLLKSWKKSGKETNPLRRSDASDRSRVIFISYRNDAGFIRFMKGRAFGKKLIYTRLSRDVWRDQIGWADVDCH